MKKPPTTLFSPRLFATIFALIATALPVALSAAIPQRWTVETSRIQPARFEGYHGETIEFAATMQTYGKPLALPPTTNHEPPTTNHEISIYWQTNGMGSAYWTAPAEIRFEPSNPPTLQPSNLVFFARWTPEMDVGADVYNCFIGAPGENYRAAFQLRLRPSPGAVPSELPLPVKTLDFAQVTVLNAPYYSKSETDAALSDKQDVVSDLATIRSGAALGATAVQPAAISDMATKSDLAGKIDVEYSPYESSTNRFEWTEAGFKVTAGRWGHLNYHEEEGVHIQFEDTYLTLLPQDAGQIVWRYPRGNKGGCLSLPSKNGVLATTSDLPTDSTISGWGYIKSYSETDPTVDGKISTHNSSSSAHADIRQSVSAKYSKPSSGIPKTDLASAVQTSLGKADSAVQPAAISDMETQTHAAATYQPKGSYLTSETDPTVDGKISTHNSSSSAHADIRTAAANAQAHSEATRQIVSTWEGFLDGSNVVFSITNYISGAYSLDHAKLQIKELLPDSNEYRIVYDSRTEITNHTAAAKREIVGYVDGVATELRGEIAEKGDKAWGRRSSTGQEVPISNTVWVTEQNLRIAGGMEYERVAVGEGAIYVLTSKGQAPYMVGDEGALMLKDDGGTNYFGMVRSDSYTIGCNTDGIRTQNNLVYLDYAVTMSDHPCIWYTESLEGDVEWEQLNLPDGSAVPGASHQVVWDESPRLGAQECYINCPEGSGFFRATIEVAGDARFRTNMPAEIPSFYCADNPDKKVKIIWNNGNPKFVEAN